MKKVLTNMLLLLIGVVQFGYASGKQSNAATNSYTDSGQGQPLVLIHPFPTDQRIWQPQVKELQKHYRVVTLDLQGFGQASPADGQAITMTQYADQVKQVLDKLHIKKAIIGGESMGGYVSLAFYAKYPDSVSGLILSDTQAIADTSQQQAKRERDAVDALENGTLKQISGFLPKAVAKTTSPALLKQIKSIMTAQAKEAYASGMRGMGLRYDTSSLLANSKLPILIITGDDDNIISPAQSQNMHELAVNSQLVVIKGAGHLTNVEKPAVWNKAVEKYFKEDNE